MSRRGLLAGLLVSGLITGGTLAAVPASAEPALVPMSPSLVGQLLSATTGSMPVMVHGATLADAERAVAATGLRRVTPDRKIGSVGAQAPKPAVKKTAPAAHVILTPGDMKWGPAPPILPAGAQVAVLDGDPFKPCFFTLRLQFPDGYQIPAHTHPTDEHHVVVSSPSTDGSGDVLQD